MSDTLPAEAEHAPAPVPVQFGARLSAGTGHNAGAVAIESERAIAEAQGQLILAKKFPRNFQQCRAEFLEACASLDFAQEAFYTVPNRGHGPSIRFAEEIARCYGNFEYGHRELSRSEGKSEIEVFAWDKERNNHSKRQITVMHVRDKTGGATPLKDQTDIDNRIANVASKQMRGRILALVPKALVAEGKAACKKTLATGGGEKTVAQRVNLMVTAFSSMGVTVAHLEGYLKHKLDLTTADELADMAGIHNAIKEGAKASDYFTAEAEGEKTDKGAAVIAASKTPAPKADTTKAEVKKEAPKPEPKQPAKAAEKPAQAKSSALPANEPPPADGPQDGPDDGEGAPEVLF